MHLNLYNSPSVSSGANPTLIAHPDPVVKVYNGANGQSPIAETIDQIAKAPFGEMLKDRFDDPVTEIGKRFFQLVDRISEHFTRWNNTSWFGYSMEVYTNGKFLEDADFDVKNLPINVAENDDEEPLKACKNLFYKHEGLNSFVLQLSLNGSCRIFKSQMDCIDSYFYYLFDLRQGVFNPSLALAQHGGGEKYINISHPSKIINASWIIEGEAYSINFNEFLIDYIHQRLELFIGCEETIIEEEKTKHLVIIGVVSGFAGIIVVCLTTCGIGYYRSLLEKEELNEEKTTLKNVLIT